jgi:hypothetical protein
MMWRRLSKGERRPTGAVLVCSQTSTAEERLVEAIFGRSPDPSRKVAIARWHRGRWTEPRTGRPIGPVTHWMPLPGLPGEQED